jgi:hypothetical protein
MPPGRVATDGADAVRNCVWACVVRQLQGNDLTWDEVDQALLSGLGLLARGDARARPRALYRYFSTGQDPASLADGELLNRVHGDPSFLLAKQTYEHPIWSISGPLPSTPSQLIVVRRALMERLGLNCLTVLERLVASHHELPGFSTYAPDHLDLIESMYNLVEGGSLDALGVCACNYLLALDCGRLEVAIGHREVLRWGAVRFCATWNIREDASRALGLLLEQRIIRRRHGVLPAKTLGFPLGHATQRSDDMACERGAPFADDLPCMLPVAPRSSDSDTFFAHFDDHSRTFAEALAIDEIVHSRLSGPEREEVSLDGLKTGNGLETVLDVPEDDCGAFLEYLHLVSSISEAYAHLAEFLPPPPDIRPRYSRRRTAAAMIAPRVSRCSIL